MGQILIKKVIFAVCLTALVAAEPQFTLGIGSTQLLADKSKFRGATYSLGLTANPFSRLQFGLRYEQGSIRLNTYDDYSVSGLLGDIRFVFNTLTNKSPYLGYGFGWLNSTWQSGHNNVYAARGSFTSEYLAGYTFRINEYTRLNLEYRNRVIALNYADRPYQRSETILAGISWILVNEPTPQKSLTPAESVTTKKTYLLKKIAYNTEQITRIDTLLAKYDQRLLELGSDKDTEQERQYLLQQKQTLEQQNQEMLQSLE